MEYIDALVREVPVMERAGILETDKRLRHFLAQGAAETGGFTIREESGAYSAEGLRKTFPKYFASVAAARPYAKRPEAIFNRVYGGRLGNDSIGDGYKYRGRGIFQLTGKGAYKEYGDRLGVDLVGNPDLAADPIVSVQIAVLYWTDRHLNEWADRDNLLAVSRGINGGSPTRNIQPNGMSDRKSWYAKITQELSFGAAAAEVPNPPVPGLHAGDTGEKVFSLQSRLRAKGYPAGNIDGIFGESTGRAVLLFQSGHNMPDRDSVWRTEYDGVLDTQPSLTIERQDVTAKDLSQQGDKTVQRLTWLQRLLMFLGLGSLGVGGTVDQAQQFPALVTQYRPVIEIFGPPLQWMANHGWLLAGGMALAGFFLARYAVTHIVAAFRRGDYQGPFKDGAQ